jgi:hypothetical protein
MILSKVEELRALVVTYNDRRAKLALEDGKSFQEKPYLDYLQAVTDVTEFVEENFDSLFPQECGR